MYEGEEVISKCNIIEKFLQENQSLLFQCTCIINNVHVQ